MKTDKPGAIKVLIGDPQRLFSGALAMALEDFSDLKVAMERPETAEAVVEAAIRLRPDVVIFDFWLQGPQTTRRILEALGDCKVLPISWLPSPEHIRAALEAGAVGFLPQSLRVADVVEGIRGAHAGEPLVFPEKLHDLVEAISRRGVQLAEWDRKLQTLTVREMEVLRTLGEGLSVVGVAERLFISPRTVNWYIRRLLAKTGASSQGEALAMARYCGLIT